MGLFCMFKQTAETLTQEPIVVKFPVTTRRKWLPWIKHTVEKTFEVRPLTLGSIIRISKLLLDISPELFSVNAGLVNVAHQVSSKHGRMLAEVTAIAFTNTEEPPSKGLIDQIEYNVTPVDLLRIFNVVLQQMDISNFMSSIISIRGINLLKEMNPTEQGSPKIASGE